MENKNLPVNFNNEKIRQNDNRSFRFGEPYIDNLFHFCTSIKRKA